MKFVFSFISFSRRHSHLSSIYLPNTTSNLDAEIERDREREDERFFFVRSLFQWMSFYLLSPWVDLTTVRWSVPCILISDQCDCDGDVIEQYRNISSALMFHLLAFALPWIFQDFGFAIESDYRDDSHQPAEEWRNLRCTHSVLCLSFD